MKHIILPALLLATNANAGLIEDYTRHVAAHYGFDGITVIKADIPRLHKACGDWQNYACTNTANHRVMVNVALESQPSMLLDVMCHEGGHLAQLRDGSPQSEQDANNRALGCVEDFLGGKL